MTQSRPFNPAVVLSNIEAVKDILRRLRQKEGGLGSEQDELALSRMILDFDALFGLTETARALATRALEDNAKLLAVIDELKGQLDEHRSADGTRQGETSGAGREQDIQLDETPP